MTARFHKRYYITEKMAKDLTKLSSAMYAESHPEMEINNPKPLFEALGIKKPMSMEEKIDRLFRGPRGLIEQMRNQGEETPEEMNDLTINDDIEPLSPHEYHVMQEELPKSPQPTQSEGTPEYTTPSVESKPKPQEKPAPPASPGVSETPE